MAVPGCTIGITAKCSYHQGPTVTMPATMARDDQDGPAGALPFSPALVSGIQNGLAAVSHLAPLRPG